jgi:hypothetical protein
MKAELKKLIESEVRKALTESITEPSEQILKGAVDVFRQQTGINPATPTLTKKGNNVVVYSTSLEKEIRTNIMKAMFNSLALEVVVTPLPNIIGGYTFLFRFKFVHPFGKQETLESGTVLFKNNKFSAQF